MIIEIENSLSEELVKKREREHSEYEDSKGIRCAYTPFKFVAKEQQSVLGVLEGFICYAEVYIDDIIVFKDCRNRGVGRSLLAAVEQHFSKDSFNNMNLVTGEFQAPEFYKKCGFTLEFIRYNRKNPLLNKYFFVKYFDKQEADDENICSGIIRKAEARDASRLAEILIFTKRTAYRKIFNNDAYSFGEMQVLPLALEFIENPKKLDGIFVFEDEFVKGLISIAGGKSMEIETLYIDTFFQKEGIGGKLMTFAFDYAAKNGYTEIFLWALEKNYNARKFYENNGFVYTEEKKLEEGTEEYLFKYRKILE